MVQLNRNMKVARSQEDLAKQKCTLGKVSQLPFAVCIHAYMSSNLKIPNNCNSMVLHVLQHL